MAEFESRYTGTQIDDGITKAISAHPSVHTHSNKSILDAITTAQSHLITGRETLSNKTLDGKPVYQMLVDFGFVPQGATTGVLVQKTVSITNVSNVDLHWIESYYMITTTGNMDSAPLPWVPAAGTVTSNAVSRLAGYLRKVSSSELEIIMSNTGGTLYNTRTIKVLIQYTKITD